MATLRYRVGIGAAMAAAVGAVILFAGLDLRREQARALQDFSAEQATLARAAAAILAASGGTVEPLAGGGVIGAATVGAAPARWLLMDGAGVFRELGAGAAPPLAGRADDVRALPEDVQRVIAAMRRGEAGALLVDRASAFALGLGHRTAVAGFAPIGPGGQTSPGGAVAVVTSAMRVRDRARAAEWRLVAATAIASVLVGLFGAAALRQQRRESRLAEALRRAELQQSLFRAEKLATIGTLAAGVAHEVSTPLGIISGRAEQLLERTPEDDRAARKAIVSILAQVGKVSTTIRQLLDFSRVRPVEAEQVRPAQALESAAALLDHRFRWASVSLTVTCPPDTPTVLADRGQLEQVLVNLLMNACDACDDCQPIGRVFARARTDGDRVVFEIADNGGGIAPEHLPHVLDPFFTTKKRGQGTGLGLSIAADIVKNHGGTIEIDSAPGRGTTVRVALPAAPAASGDPA